MKKYVLTDEKIIYKGRELYRIKANKSFGIIDKGEPGGWVESEENLSQTGNCWITKNAKVWGGAKIYENAWVGDNAEIYGNARIYDNSWVYQNAKIFGNAQVFENSWVCGQSSVYDNAKIFGDSRIFGKMQISGNVKIQFFPYLNFNLELFNNKFFKISGNVEIDEKNNKISVFDMHPLYLLVVTNNPKVLFHFGDFTGTLEEFKQKIFNKNLTII